MLFASRNVSPVEGDNAFFDYEQKLVREMFQKDDMVRYGAHGVCKVEDITEKNFNGEAIDRKSTRLNSSHYQQSRMPSSA